MGKKSIYIPMTEYITYIHNLYESVEKEKLASHQAASLQGSSLQGGTHNSGAGISSPIKKQEPGARGVDKNQKTTTTKTHTKNLQSQTQPGIKKVEFVSVSLASLPRGALGECFSPDTTGAALCTQSSHRNSERNLSWVHFCSNQMNEGLPLQLWVLKN